MLALLAVTLGTAATTGIASAEQPTTQQSQPGTSGPGYYMKGPGMMAAE